MLHELISKVDLKDFREIIALLMSQEHPILLRNDILLTFEHYCDLHEKNVRFRTQSSIVRFLSRIQEALVLDEHLVIMHRYAIARYRYYRLRSDAEQLEEIAVREYLDLKARQILGEHAPQNPLQIDLTPFYDYAPLIRDPKAIGLGIRFLNRYLCSSNFQNPEAWNAKSFQFIKLHSYGGQQLLVNGDIIKDPAAFYAALMRVLPWLAEKKPATPVRQVSAFLKKAGFEPGWGSTAGRIRETMQTLVDFINEPSPELLETFISRVPMPLISKIAIISPHGWFAQEQVLGRPDTGGQVIYILDQVRALERYLKREIALQGITVEPQIIVITRLIPEAEETTCNIRREKIHGTDNGWILRVPFRDTSGQTLPSWVSRFEVWPYLERFADEAEIELLSEFQGRPDLIIGNYSDGNLVASLLSDRLDVIQCTIAHALEKTKYLFSDLYWQELEDHYHFSLQFMADVLSMNKSDFIITSTHQEIIGTDDTMGQYESYQHFTLPSLVQVTGGINLYAPKFNVIPPGVDETLYFPYFEQDRRTDHQRRHWERRLFEECADDIFGGVLERSRIPIFTMARFDRIKNLTGLIEAYGLSDTLKEHCSLILAAGTIHARESLDSEERAEIEKAYALIERYGLAERLRWLPSINKLDTGEVYRIIADHRGIFVQPALFEAFGLTILEAMLSGLPTFGPLFGGPQEIIEPGVSGFLINTSSPPLIAKALEDFVLRMHSEGGYWEQISQAGISRIRTHFTWELYSERLVNLAKLYGFWRFAVSGQAKLKMDRYCDLIYHFLFKERAASLMR